MEERSGYRIKVDNLDGMARFLDAVRQDLLRVLRLQYGRSVASEAARLADLHRLGVRARNPQGSPLEDATRIVRGEWRTLRMHGEWHPDLDFVAALYMTKDGVLARIEYASAPYRKAWEARPEVERFEWHQGARPRSVTADEWERRRGAWEIALAPPALARGLRLSVLDRSLPTMRAASVRRCVPRRDRRVRMAARSIALKDGLGIEPARGTLPERAAKWLRTDEGRAAWSAAERRVGRELADVAGADDLSAYGVATPRTAAAARELRMIDHVDVVEASDGTVFVAVRDGGLQGGRRVLIQVGDAHVSIMQDGVQFGHVDSASRLALDLLRSLQTATLVEVQENGERRSLKAKHVAIIMDVGLTDTFQETMGRWRKTSSAVDKEKEEWLQT